MRKISPIALAVVLAAGTTFAGIAYSGEGKHGKEYKTTQEMIEKLDKDNDQNISRAEAEEHGKLSDSFAEVDQDNDGVLSSEELSQWKDEKKDRKKSD